MSRSEKKTAAAVWHFYAVAGIACCIVSAGGYLAGIQPAMADRDANQSAADELESRRRSTAEAATALSAVRQKLIDARTQIAALPLHLQQASELNQRLAKLTDLAQSFGLQITAVQPAGSIDARHCLIIPIRIGGAGSYPAMARFLHQLPGTFPDTAVKSIQIANPLGSRDNPVGTFQLELSWYTAKGS